MTDEQLLAAYVAGEDREAAFAELVTRYERRVYAICYRYFGNHADAEDAAQDTFVTLARRAATFSGDSRLSTWLYRVTVNTCNDLARRRARRPRPAPEDVPERADPDDAYAARETALEVERALTRLDDLSRTLLVLVAVEGLSYSEVSAITDLPVGTIKSRVHRARAQLADLLAGLHTDRDQPSATPPTPRTSHLP